MNALRKMVQGTPEWHEHRKQHRNASESPAVMGLSPWMTPYKLWLIKTGRAQPDGATAPMKHGTEMEPQARAAYEAKAGTVMQPLVMTSGEYSASLDGINLSGNLIVEVKCPYKGQSSELWQSVEAGEIPEMYRIQIQHQLMVSGATLAHLWVFDGNEGLLLDVDQDEVCQQRIRNAWDEFQHYVDTDTPPPLSEYDSEFRNDAEWIAAAEQYCAAKVQTEEAAKVLEEAKELLLSLASTHPSIKGGGVTVSRFWKAGSAGLEQQEGNGNWVVKVSVDRHAKAIAGTAKYY
ncbi:MAG: YqaJ viral recombinase family protein [Gallionella sp.]|nr:YqaJ viral recombinase family protein [Gallionella sp.]